MTAGVPRTDVVAPSGRFDRAVSRTGDSAASFGRANVTLPSVRSVLLGGPRPWGVRDRGRGASPRPAAVFARRFAGTTKKGSSSPIEASRRGRPTPRESTSSRPIRPVEIAPFRSRKARNSSSRPSTVRTIHISGALPVSRLTRNLWPHWVHRTLVPWSETSASSNSYSVLQRSQVTSMGTAPAYASTVAFPGAALLRARPSPPERGRSTPEMCCPVPGRCEPQFTMPSKMRGTRRIAKGHIACYD